MQHAIRVAALFCVLASSQAFAANVNIDGLPAATSVAGTDLYECEQGGINNHCTPAQLSVYLNALISGDCTISANVITCTKTNNTPFGALATVTPGAGVAAAAGNATGGTGGFVTFGGAAGTLTGNVTGNAATVTTNANLTGDVISSGNASTYNNVVPAAKGGAGTITGALKGSGAGVVTQAACADLSNGATGCSTAVGTSGATIGLLNAANAWSAIQTFAAGDIVLTGGSGCATFTAGVLGSTGSACGSGGSTTITAGTTPTSGITSGNLLGSTSNLAVDSGVAFANVVTLASTQTLTNKTLTSPTLTTPALGTPASGTLTNTTGFPLANLSGAGTGVLSLLGGTSSGTGGPAGTASPTFTGTPAAPTATVGTNTTQVATTAFVIANAGSGTGANPTATAGPTAVNGSATTFMRSDGAPAIQLATASQKGIAQVDGTTITAASGVISAIPLVTSRAVAGTTDTTLQADQGNIVYLSSASSIAVTLGSSFGTGFFTTYCTTGAGTATLTATSIAGGTTYSIPGGGSVSQPNCATVQYSGATYDVAPSFTLNASLLSSGVVAAARGGAGTINGALKGNGSGTVSQAACADLSNGATGCSTTLGTNVATAAGNTLSSAGGLTSTIFHGTAALGISAISSGTCATAVNVTAANVATTDVVTAGFAADPTATTGFLPTAMLTIVPYVASAGNIGVKVCNLTASSITPSALTINVSAVR